jgi:predicted component of viral defense system (DUF524 family)
VIDDLRRSLGTPSRASRGTYEPTRVRLKWDFVVEWATGARCFYNVQVSRDEARPHRTYSVGLRPDVAVAIPGRGLHLFDAKLELHARSASEHDASREGQTTFRRADLYKMHAYRDAVVDARSARISIQAR